MKRLVALSLVLTLTSPLFAGGVRAEDSIRARAEQMKREADQASLRAAEYRSQGMIDGLIGTGGLFTSIGALAYQLDKFGPSSAKGGRIAGLGFVGGLLVAFPAYTADAVAMAHANSERRIADDLELRHKALERQLERRAPAVATDPMRKFFKTSASKSVSGPVESGTPSSAAEAPAASEAR